MINLKIRSYAGHTFREIHMALRIELLGQPRISRDGEPMQLPGHRPLALLAYLVVTGKPQPRENLAALLFDEPGDPRAALRWTLHKLRKALGADYLLAGPQEIAFNFQSDYWLDVSAFEAGEIDLYRGEFLGGFYLRDGSGFEEWLLFEREHWRGRYQTALEQQLDQYASEGNYAAVVASAQKLIALDNYREDWHRALMAAYAHLGKRQAALAHFDHCRQVLREELDVAPAPETEALADAIRSGQVGPGTRTESEPGWPYPAPPVDDQAGESLETRETPPRRVFSSPVYVLLALITLVVLLSLGLVGVLNANSRARGNPGGLLSTAGSAGQREPGSQALAGTTVTVLGLLTGEDAGRVEQAMTPLEERTGIQVVYLSVTREFVDFVATSLEQESPPDIVGFPQPGYLATFARQGKIKPVSTFLDRDYLQGQYPDSFIDLVTLDGEVIGVWHTVGIKSLVWYPKRAFEAKGYAVPETWDDLTALSDQIVADGGTPWCIGIESGDGTGWVGTDWVEDILLRTAPPESYDAWVRHDLPFNSPQVRRAFEIMGQIWLRDEYVYGGTENILDESWADSPVHLFEQPPGCYLHRQASWITTAFPDTASYGQDYDFFYLPPIDPELGKPVLGSGDIYAMINDRPEVREVMRYLTTPESAKAMIEYGGYLAPHKGTPIEWYPTAKDLRYFQILLSADTYRFDGSDLMPGEVGTGAFWHGIIAWLEGADLETVLEEIDRSWPE